MASPEVANLLARLVRTGRITVQQATDLARRVFPVSVLPLPVSQGLTSRELDSQYVRAYEGNWKGQGAIRLSRSSSVRATYRDTLQRDFEKQVTNLAHSVSSGRLSVRQWQTRMKDAIEVHTIRQAALGRGSTMTKSEVLRDVVPRVNADLAYLQRFADELSLSRIGVRPLSVNQVVSRSTLYGGTGRAEWFRQNEQRASQPGFVVRYRARDDNGTCDPCRTADGWYLPNEGPMPGEICRGRSRCRCRRDIVENRAIYDRLTQIEQPRTA